MFWMRNQVCVCFSVSRVPGIPFFYDWVPYHCVRGGYFQWLDSNPPRVVYLALLESGCPVVCPEMSIHVLAQGTILYMRMCDYFPTTTPTSNNDSYKCEQRIDRQTEHQFSRKCLRYLSCNTRDKFYLRERDVVVHYTVAWEYKVKDVLALPRKPCTR